MWLTGNCSILPYLFWTCFMKSQKECILIKPNKSSPTPDRHTEYAPGRKADLYLLRWCKKSWRCFPRFSNPAQPGCLPSFVPTYLPKFLNIIFIFMREANLLQYYFVSPSAIKQLPRQPPIVSWSKWLPKAPLGDFNDGVDCSAGSAKV